MKSQFDWRPFALIVTALVGPALLLDVYVRSNHTATPVATQSWDQENLKRNDSGCPTAIYVAPNGDLRQCE